MRRAGTRTRIRTLLALLLLAVPALPAQSASAVLDRRSFPDAAGPILTAYAREALLAYREGRVPAETLPAPFAAAGNGAHILLFREGRLHGEAHADQSRLAGNIRVAAARAAAGLSGGDPGEVDLVLTVLLPERVIPGRKPLPVRVLETFRRGVDGMRAGFGGREALLPPLLPLVEPLEPEELLSALAREVAPATEAPGTEAQDESTRLLRILTGLAGPFELRYVPGITFARTEAGETARLVRLSRPVADAEVTAGALAEAADLAGRWLTAELGAIPGTAPSPSSPVEPDAGPEEETERLFARADAFLLAQFDRATAPAPELRGAFRDEAGGVRSARASAEGTRILARAAIRARRLAHPHAARYSRGTRAGARYLLYLQIRGRIDALDLPGAASAIGALRPAPEERGTDAVLTALAFDTFREAADALAPE